MNLESYQEKKIGQHRKDVYVICISRSENFMVSASWDKTIKIWDMQNPNHNQILGRHQDIILAACISNDDSIVVSSSIDIKLWDL